MCKKLQPIETSSMSPFWVPRGALSHSPIRALAAIQGFTYAGVSPARFRLRLSPVRVDLVDAGVDGEGGDRFGRVVTHPGRAL